MFCLQRVLSPIRNAGSSSKAVEGAESQRNDARIASDDYRAWDKFAAVRNVEMDVEHCSGG
jgi:hypothetical protein